jgi:hypothetical protein
VEPVGVGRDSAASGGQAELKRHAAKIVIRSGFCEGHSPAHGARGYGWGEAVPGSLLLGGVTHHRNNGGGRLFRLQKTAGPKEAPNASGPRYVPQKRKREKQKGRSSDQERSAVCVNSGEADAALDCPCMTMQTSRTAIAAEIVPSVIAKNAKAPLLMHSPRY